MSMSLDADVRAALEKRRGEWRLIAEQSNVSHSWISQFVRGKIPNPGYETLRGLARMLGVGDDPPIPTPAPEAPAVRQAA